VAFDFSEPLPGFGGDARGLTGAINFFGYELAYVVWDNPLQLAFGTSGIMEVILSHEKFSVPGSATVSATFNLVREDSGAPIPVPEPASALLLLFGAFCSLTGSRRRRWKAL
jgi:hypothetical protein